VLEKYAGKIYKKGGWSRGGGEFLKIFRKKVLKSFKKVLKKK
jgi:hypothetical protein